MIAAPDPLAAWRAWRAREKAKPAPTGQNPLPAACARLSDTVRRLGPDHPEAVAAGEAVLAACEGFAATLDSG
jgi:hypothetical protein